MGDWPAAAILSAILAAASVVETVGAGLLPITFDLVRVSLDVPMVLREKDVPCELGIFGNWGRVGISEYLSVMELSSRESLGCCLLCMLHHSFGIVTFWLARRGGGEVDK